MDKHDQNALVLGMYGLTKYSETESKLFQQVLSDPEKTKDKKETDNLLRAIKEQAILTGVAAMIQLNNQKLQEKLEKAGIELDLNDLYTPSQ